MFMYVTPSVYSCVQKINPVDLCMNNCSTINNYVIYLYMFVLCNIFIGYWLDMEIYVRELRTRTSTYISISINNLFITDALLSQKTNNLYYIIFINKISKFTSLFKNKKMKFKTEVNQLLPLPFLRLSGITNMNV